MLLNRIGRSSSNAAKASVLAGESEKTMSSMLMWPQPPVASSTISRWAVWPGIRGRSVTGAYWFEALIVFAGSGANGFTVDDEADLGGIATAAADEKTDERAFDGEGLAGEFSLGVVAIDEGIDKTFPVEAGDVLLMWQCAVNRFGSEGGSFDGPFAVAVFEVVK